MEASIWDALLSQEKNTGMQGNYYFQFINFFAFWMEAKGITFSRVDWRKNIFLTFGGCSLLCYANWMVALLPTHGRLIWSNQLITAFELVVVILDGNLYLFVFSMSRELDRVELRAMV